MINLYKKSFRNNIQLLSSNRRHFANKRNLIPKSYGAFELEDEEHETITPKRYHIPAEELYAPGRPLMSETNKIKVPDISNF